MKVMRKGEIIEVEEILPGDIAIIETDGVPRGHVHIVQGTPEKWTGLYPDEDIDWDANGYEDY